MTLLLSGLHLAAWGSTEEADEVECERDALGPPPPSLFMCSSRQV